MTGHDRLRTNEEHARLVGEMFRWLERNSPLKAMCPWCISVGGAIGHFDSRFQFDGWIEEINGQLVPRTAYETMRQLRFDRERADELADTNRIVIRLAVPYVSQFDDTARTHNADCGPASMAMILNIGKPAGNNVTVDELYGRYLPNKAFSEFTTLDEMLQIGRGEGLTINRRDFSAANALEELRKLIRANTPFAALVNYSKWDEIARNNFQGAHFVVVTGFDEDHIFVHDPLFRGQRRGEGEFFVWRNQRFLDGWGSGQEIGNPNFSAVIPEKTAGRLG
jgi:uncharacterized protein YvpB